MSPSAAQEAWVVVLPLAASAGQGSWEHALRHTSLCLFSSQDLKLNCISKEINFKVLAMPV